MQGPARFRRRPSFPSRLPPQRYRGPPLKRASGRLRHQSRPRCPPLSAQSPQSKQALGRNGRLTQPRHRPLSAQGPQPKHVFGRTGSRIQPRSPPPSARGLQLKQRLAATTYLFHPAAGESHPTRLRASISSQMTASASRPPNFTFLSLPVRHSEPDLPPDAGERIPGQTNLPFQVPRWRRLPVRHSGYCAPVGRQQEPPS
ncbi:hypothetical protein G5714_001153 [Onychostoma macrolepis]|uniref:Uncharacterized protein n=1 Tax=Onychostoma macrolepis TaxID=369639 RepID=A0A7J6DIF0_9TELE|nr:hypothetical protein G5714_001153 [Onychostoma macrolepis]